MNFNLLFNIYIKMIKFIFPRRKHEKHYKHHHHHKFLAKQILFSITIQNQTISKMATLTLSLNTTQQDIITASGADINGISAPISNITWSIDDSSIGTLTADLTGTTATFVALTSGTANITVNATDVNGTTLPAATGVITVTADLAVSIVLTAGTPTAKA